jgi:hypothetical protein
VRVCIEGMGVRVTAVACSTLYSVCVCLYVCVRVCIERMGVPVTAVACSRLLSDHGTFFLPNEREMVMDGESEHVRNILGTREREMVMDGESEHVRNILGTREREMVMDGESEHVRNILGTRVERDGDGWRERWFVLHA